MTNPPPESIRVLAQAGVQELDLVLALADSSSGSQPNAASASAASLVPVAAVVPLATPLPFYVLDCARHYTGTGPGPDGVWLLALAPQPSNPEHGSTNDDNDDSISISSGSAAAAAHAMLVCRAGALDLWTVLAGPAAAEGLEPPGGLVAESTLTLAPRRTAPRVPSHAPASSSAATFMNTNSTITATAAATPAGSPPPLSAAEADALRHTIRAALRLRGLATAGSDELYTQTLVGARYALAMAKQRAAVAGASSSSSSSARRKSTVGLAQVQETVDALLTLFLGE
ncbi:hypothetical protein DV454_001097 [Geotrichum candidum]|nr:hypothetical protein DV454_001097 [Geotrichum candidum]